MLGFVLLCLWLWWWSLVVCLLACLFVFCLLVCLFVCVFLCVDCCNSNISEIMEFVCIFHCTIHIFRIGVFLWPLQALLWWILVPILWFHFRLPRAMWPSHSLAWQLWHGHSVSICDPAPLKEAFGSFLGGIRLFFFHERRCIDSSFMEAEN